MSDKGSDSWMMFQYDPGNTGHAEATTGISTPVQSRWQFETGGSVIWPPVVANGRVFATSFAGTMYALDTDDGTQEWTIDIPEVPNSAPAVMDSTVYVGGQATGIYAIDAATGRQKWHTEINRPKNSPAAVANGIVFINGGYWQTLALDAATGKILWEYTTDEGYRGRKTYPEDEPFPAVADGKVYFANPSGLDVLDAESGDQLWHVDGRFQTATVRDGTVFVVDLDDERLYAIEDEGRIRWQVRTGSNGIVYSVAVDPTTVYFGTGYFEDTGTIYALDVATGTTRWTFETDRYGALFSPPTVVNDTVYIGSGDGGVYALDTEEGTQQWRYEIGHDIWAPPVVADRTVYVASNGGGLYALAGDAR